MPLLSTLRALTLTISRSTSELHGSLSLCSIGISDAANLASVQTPSNAIEFQVELLSLETTTTASESEEVETIRRVTASSDLLKAPVLDELVTANNDIQGLDALWRRCFYKYVSSMSARSFRSTY